MPKKSASARGGAQRNKPKVQKNIELVRPTTASNELALEASDDSDAAEPTPTAIATSVETMATPRAKSSGTTRRRNATAPKVRESSALLATTEAKTEEKDAEEQEEAEPVAPAEAALAAPAVPKSAAARLAARRQSGQKNSPRSAVTLITSEHYSYVRKDLAFIAVLAIIMFAAIIILHFVPGIGS
ncbi:MAG: hypothetical protein ACYDER_23485 [Ktedonobacteraceae bacterium]